MATAKEGFISAKIVLLFYMANKIQTNFSLMKYPSAWLPLVMTFIPLAVGLIHGAMTGFVHETDEGIAAHLWQILMVAQIPIVLFFAIKWLPQKPKQALVILALQAGAYLASLAAVFFLT